MSKQKTKSDRKSKFRIKAFVLGVVFALAVIAGALLNHFQTQHKSKNIPPAIVYLPENNDVAADAGSEDAIGDFILHHEYFAADKEALEDNDEDENLSAKDNTGAYEQSAAPVSDIDHLRVSSENAPVSLDEELSVSKTPKRIILNKIDVEVPLIAIVVDDMGINQKRTKDIISLKAPLTASFLTYGSHLVDYASLSKASGHEIMIHAPMEPKVKANLAPDTLLIEMDHEQIENMFDNMLEKFADIHVSGINNHMGSRFTEDKEKLALIMEILKKRQMFFLDSKTTASSKGKELAEEDGVDYAARDVFLDNENDYDYITAQLNKTEKIAAKKGFAIAICHPKSQTFLALKDWLKTLSNKPIKLVHVSEIVKAVNKQQAD